MSEEDDRASRIKDMINKAIRQEADEASALYLARLITLFMFRPPQVSVVDMQQQIDAGLREGEAAAKRIEPLAALKVPLFMNPEDCGLFKSTVTGVVARGMALEGVTDQDIEACVNILNYIHTPHCKKPQSHVQ